jgi:hypothetical protein
MSFRGLGFSARWGVYACRVRGVQYSWDFVFLAFFYPFFRVSVPVQPFLTGRSVTFFGPFWGFWSSVGPLRAFAHLWRVRGALHGAIQAFFRAGFTFFGVTGSKPFLTGSKMAFCG